MNRALVSITSISVAFIVAACGSSKSNPQPSGQGGSNGVGGSSDQMGGTTAGTAGGTTAGTTGGTGAGTTGGSATGGTSTASSVPQVITSSDGNLWKTGTYTTGATGTADITVTDGTQKWTGFGGTFNEAGWDALKALGTSDQQLALKLLYDATDGANFAYGRIPIGASDYALTEYTLDDTANDTSMTNFSIDKDKANLIPFIQAAIAVKSGIHFWGSPWSPPAWMKSNNSLHSSTKDNPPYADADGFMKDDATNLAAFALYLEKFVQEYAKVGITIEAIYPQNEPGYGNPYPSCYWTSDAYIKFIRDVLGPKFQTDLPNVAIWGGTFSSSSDGTMATNLASDTAAMAFVKGFGLQWNTMNKVGSLTSKGPIMMTEHRCGNYNFAVDNKTGGSGDFSWDPNTQYSSTAPQNDYAYGVETWKWIRDWVKAGVNSYSAWNMVLDTSGVNLNKTTPWHQNALLVVDRAGKKLIQTPAYYVFRHLSQYVKLPATVSRPTAGDALAFKNADSSYTVVVYNKDAAKNMIVSIGGTKLQIAAPNNGWVTINYKP